MRFTNSWLSKTKQWDKFELCLRIAVIDFVLLKYDNSNKYFEFKILNLGIKINE